MIQEPRNYSQNNGKHFGGKQSSFPLKSNGPKNTRKDFRPFKKRLTPEVSSTQKKTNKKPIQQSFSCISAVELVESNWSRNQRAPKRAEIHFARTPWSLKHPIETGNNSETNTLTPSTNSEDDYSKALAGFQIVVNGKEYSTQQETQVESQRKALFFQSKATLGVRENLLPFPKFIV